MTGLAAAPRRDKLSLPMMNNTYDTSAEPTMSRRFRVRTDGSRYWLEYCWSQSDRRTARDLHWYYVPNTRTRSRDLARLMYWYNTRFNRGTHTPCSSACKRATVTVWEQQRGK